MLTSAKLAAIIKKRGMFKAEVARRCGYSPARISQFLAGASISKGAEIRLIAGLQITKEELESHE